MLEYSNIKLEVYNVKFIGGIMKNFFLPIFFVTMILMVAGIQVYQVGTPQDPGISKFSEMIHVAGILIMLGAGIYYNVKRVRARKMGFPEEDELSIKIVRKSASTSFYLSFLIWLIVLFIRRFNLVDEKLLFSYGFIGMSLTFVLVLCIFNFKGIGDA